MSKVWSPNNTNRTPWCDCVELISTVKTEDAAETVRDMMKGED